MSAKEKQLGALVGAYGMSPAFLQRAAIISVVSFIFFLVMLIAFSMRQNLGYFLLATAFLIVQLFTLFGWIMQKRSVFRLFENGFTYRKHVCLWSEIESINVNAKKRAGAGSGCEITKANGEKIVLPETIYGIERIIEKIRKVVKSEK
jgi:hypothetical protein